MPVVLALGKVSFDDLKLRSMYETDDIKSEVKSDNIAKNFSDESIFP